MVPIIKGPEIKPNRTMEEVNGPELGLPGRFVL